MWIAEILFKPFMEGGERVLQLVRLKLQQKMRRWTEEYMPKPVEMDSSEDLMYLRSLEPTSYKVREDWSKE